MLKKKNWGYPRVSILDEKLIRAFECKLNTRLQLILEFRGNLVLDEKRALLLKLIDEKKSILMASKMLNISYSRAWEWIFKIENVLGVEIVKRMRGGRGGGKTILTPEGKSLLELYFTRAKEHGLIISPKELLIRKVGYPDIIYAGSHDPATELLLSTFAGEKGLKVEFSWIGSCAGLLAIMLGEADVAGIHLIDVETGEYNLPYIKKYGLEDKVILIRGFTREICLAYGPGIKIRSLKEAIEKGYKLINRNIGSGTRILLEYLIRRLADTIGFSVKDLKNRIPGWDTEAKTHFEVAEAILSRKADYGLMLSHIAEMYGLEYIPIIREHFDFIIRLESIDKLANLGKFLKQNARIFERMKGYIIPHDIGEIIYKP